jgi:hypothetical protein
VIVRAGNEVRSELIARHLEVEFRRCGLLPDSPPPTNGGLPDTPSDSDADSLSGGHTKIDRVDPGKEPFPQADSLTPSYALDDGVVVSYLSREEPQPFNPQPVPPTAGSDTLPGLAVVAEPVEPGPINAGHVVAAWAEGFATTGNRPVERLRKQVGKEARELLDAGNDPQRVLAAARVLGTKGRATLVTELAIQSQTTPTNGIAASDQNIINIQSLKARFPDPQAEQIWKQLPGGSAS